MERKKSGMSGEKSGKSGESERGVGLYQFLLRSGGLFLGFARRSDTWAGLEKGGLSTVDQAGPVWVGSVYCLPRRGSGVSRALTSPLGEAVSPTLPNTGDT